MDYKNSNTLPMSKKRYTKQDKINNYRKKYANIRHQYYAMCDKYSSYNKTMLTFTIPSKINNAIIQGKYSKTAYLVELRTYIAKQFNNANSEIKCFSNIELGSKRNNPHAHIQVWCNDYDEVYNIYQKTISKFNLNKSRCKMTLPEYDNKNYDYVIKDYKKDISDVEIWANENAKKCIRKHLGKQVRFYNMSKDKYSQHLYKFVYRLYNKFRLFANDFIDCLASIFKGVSADELVVIRELKSKLVDILEQELNRCYELCYDIKKATYHIQKLICYWIYGFI